MELFKKWQMFDDDGAGSEGAGGNPADNNDPKPELKYSDEDLDRILQQKKAKWQKAADKAAAEAAEVAKMDAQQKAEHERDQLKAELDQLRAANTKASLTATARKTLTDAGVTVADNIVESLIGDDEDATIDNAKAFAVSWSASLDNAVKSKLDGYAPKKGSSGSETKLTKADILNIKNPELRQKAMLENRELFGL